jgi:hypothetical protein
MSKISISDQSQTVNSQSLSSLNEQKVQKNKIARKHSTLRNVSFIMHNQSRRQSQSNILNGVQREEMRKNSMGVNYFLGSMKIKQLSDKKNSGKFEDI